MDIKTRKIIRTKKLGVLIRDARLASRKSIRECAEAIGVSPATFSSYERGRKAPSLPELEILSYFLDLPLEHFWDKNAISDDPPPTESIDLERLKALRQRMIGALLRQERENAGLSMRALSQQAGIPARRLRSYELGERPIPLPELEALLIVLDSRVETFFDRSGPIGQWLARQRAIQAFLELPPELQEFIGQPVNRPYLELARHLSDLSVEKLRSVAEGLLDITL